MKKATLPLNDEDDKLVQEEVKEIPKIEIEDEGILKSPGKEIEDTQEDPQENIQEDKNIKVEEDTSEQSPPVENNNGIQEEEVDQTQEQQTVENVEGVQDTILAELPEQDTLNESQVPSNDVMSHEDILVELNYVSKDDMDAARNASPDDPIAHLLNTKKITKDILGQAIAEHYNLTYFDLNTEDVPTENYYAISMTIAKSLRIVIIKKNDKSLTITTDEPFNEYQINEGLLNIFPGIEIIMMYSLTEDIDDAFKVYRVGLQERLDNVLNSDDPNFAAQYFDELVIDALDKRASDIHLEPNPDNVLIRFRVDGLLQEMANISHDYYENLLNRIKVLSNIRLDEHYRAQDGAIRYKIDGIPIDLRISIIPIMEGQKVAIRLLADYIKNMALQDLGLNENNFKLVQRASKKTYGMILSTGPTGSGKTTTLYSLLKTLNKPEVNITTIEDPVEYRIPGVNQIQVNIDNEITFAKGLRSVVRQDPNIILVGEIRDKETVEIAVNAALTGHLLLSTFHANNAASAIPRLLDMGVEPFLLASTLNLIVAERLVRKICHSCKFSKEYSEAELKKLMPIAHKIYFKKTPIRLYQGKGCEKCNFTGYKGRMGIFETIYVTEAVQDLILRSASSKEVWAVAQKEGAANFFTDGLEKVMLGEISLEELLRVAPVETQDDDVYGKKG